jgi:putative lipoprotein (rSAM/lipoprotein system)
MLERNMEVKDGELQGDPERVKQWLEQSAVKTDKDGGFVISNSGLPQEEVKLMVRDVDGAENGEYKNQVLEMKVRQGDVDRTNAGGWNQGTFNKEVEIKLESK